LPSRAYQSSTKDAILIAVFTLSSYDDLLSTWNCVEHDNAVLVSCIGGVTGALVAAHGCDKESKANGEKGNLVFKRIR
jgi:hypothetical protein